MTIGARTSAKQQTMKNETIGKAISFLRKQAGFTQKDLAERIGISDKAVSKWERGLGLPDVAYLRKLSILLDTDTDSLLAGTVGQHDTSWQGIIVLDENPYGIGARTIIFDKPLVYFLLSYFLLVGIRHILIVCSEADKAFVDQTIQNGEGYGIQLRTFAGSLKDALETNAFPSDNTMLVYGRCILYGVDQTRFFQKAMHDRHHFTMLVLPKKISHQAMRVLMDENGKVVNVNFDEPLRTQYDFSDIPILFLPTHLLPMMASAKCISDFVREYAAEKELYVQMLDRGFVEIEVETWEDVQEASLFLRIIQDRCGMNVYCLEEVAWRRGMITTDQLARYGELQKNTDYGRYILGLCDRILRDESK